MFMEKKEITLPKKLKSKGKMMNQELVNSQNFGSLVLLINRIKEIGKINQIIAKLRE